MIMARCLRDSRTLTKNCSSPVLPVLTSLPQSAIAASDRFVKTPTPGCARMGLQSVLQRRISVPGTGCPTVCLVPAFITADPGTTTAIRTSDKIGPSSRFSGTPSVA